MTVTIKLSPMAKAALKRAHAEWISRSRPSPRRRNWTLAEESVLKARYADEPTESIAADLGLTAPQVYRKANQLGLHKSEKYLKQCLAACGQQLNNSGKASRFPTGHRPWNQGLKGLSVNGHSADTQFKKGSKPGNWLPIGSTRTTPDGYLQRKVTDTGYPPADWISVHILLWEEHNGPIPAGHCLCFKDGNKTRIVLENLELITRAERMRRNTIHRYPDELKSVIRAVGKLKRAIREVEHEKQD
ncbi:HNH endonuclease [Pseudomonas gingeri NCPPB 3146 = LMG 5327]|uniref:HNH endonuclease n=2 Tax=Pseudomonas gingeri TaxID=117681 RepID=A0A7Y7Y2C7_9PSED|nr:HNH endonuclease signature motif containing protein [Pseudomonas gingeri]NWC16486.1 HNH endonuclease [Pseudomonas gingeri]PNQ91152.1 HNH endonuclease [Pseudomonas gingeri NCPPB 3146 = LMG 5327]